MAFALNPHRRLNPLTGEWVLVSPHRTDRPWQGQVEKRSPPAQVHHDPNCYLCPGNARAGGARNPDYASTFAFDNDFPALKPDIASDHLNQDELLVASTERGICRVLCFSPDHSLTVSGMSVSALTEVVEAWAAQFRELAHVEWIRTVQIFENRGEMMGASNPHPHCQIWSSESISNELGKEAAHQQAYLDRYGSCLLCRYLELEQANGERVVCGNEAFIAVVPYWAVWPFEVMVLPRRHFNGMDQLTITETEALARILKDVTSRYDRLFEAPFPYTMGFHQRPTDGREYPAFHLHGHYYPPLLRSATVRKFMVGFEMLGTPQRDITPETAAERLRRAGGG